MQVKFPRRLALLPLAALGGCGTMVLDPQGPVAGGERLILLDSLAIMLVIVVPTLIAALGFAWWFRAGNERARYLPHWVYSGRVELVVWSIPILVILFLGGVIWVGSHDLDPYRPLQSKVKPIEVQVVSLDWKWLFIYPQQGIATVNQLVVPVGVPVHFTITSASVMNSFFIPKLGSQIYAMNGMVTQLNLQADKPGDYYGESAQFSGDGFSDMNFVAHALPADRFAGWASGARGRGPALNVAVYRGLSRQGTMPAVSYGAVQPDLFTLISTQKLPPQAGPAIGRAGHAEAPRTIR
jgi:cytochrome o ubiquinol oxidase subunit II